MPERYLLISIGNTRTRMAVGDDDADRLEPSRVVDNTDAAAVVAAIIEYATLHHAGDTDDQPKATASPHGLRILVATVNPALADQVCTQLRARWPTLVVARFGTELPIPVANTLTDDTTVGQDRLLDALGAYLRSKQACVVIDAGTAVTVDFIDGEGVFHGGAIAPGVSMMLTAMHEHTASLPKVTLDPKLIPAGVARGGGGGDGGGGGEGGEGDGLLSFAAAPFGKTTAEAMTLGAVSAVRGLVHLLVDQYAEFYGGYPRVVATGGDAPLLFESDPIVEAVVPDLPLIGMLAAIQVLKQRGESGEGEADDEDEEL